MRIIDGDELVMWLSKWMISSFGTEPTEETKAIKVVCDAVGDMVKELEREKKGGGLIRRQDAIDAMVAEVDRIIDNICIQNVTEARLRDAVNRLPSAEPEVLAHGEGELSASAESNADQRTQSVGSVDTISRQAAIDAVCANCLRQDLDVFDGCLDEDCSIKPVLESLPSAEPKEVYCPMASRACFANGKEVAWCLTCSHISEEDRELVKKAVEGSQPKTGRWIEIPLTNHTYKCSECGRLLVNVTDGKNNVSKHYPYCHCGADMRGGKNDKR